MVVVRNGTFETNSSSSHSLVFCKKSTWTDFVNGKLFYNALHDLNGYPEFCTWKDIKRYIKNEIKDIYPKNFLEMSKKDVEKYRQIRREHNLSYFEDTFYSIDELEGYNYNEETNEAHLDYYFG